jgi:hypothetical protein
MCPSAAAPSISNGSTTPVDSEFVPISSTKATSSTSAATGPYASKYSDFLSNVSSCLIDSDYSADHADRLNGHRHRIGKLLKGKKCLNAFKSCIEVADE